MSQASQWFHLVSLILPWERGCLGNKVFLLFPKRRMRAERKNLFDYLSLESRAIKRVKLIIQKGTNGNSPITCLSVANVSTRPGRVVKSGIFLSIRIIVSNPVPSRFELHVLSYRPGPMRVCFYAQRSRSFSISRFVRI